MKEIDGVVNIQFEALYIDGKKLSNKRCLHRDLIEDIPLEEELRESIKPRDDQYF